MKNCFGGTFDDFLGKGGVLPQKLTLLFLGWEYFISVFQKKAVFSKKIVKNRFWGPSLLKGRGCLATKMNITFFYGKCGFKYFFI